MNEKKYQLLELIDKSDYGADNIDMLLYIQSAKHFFDFIMCKHYPPAFSQYPPPPTSSVFLQH